MTQNETEKTISAKSQTISIILAGTGGQGILFATRVLAAAAQKRGLPILGSEIHGMAQRGGSVVSHLKFGEAQSPLVRRGTADFLYALEPIEGIRALPFLKKGGVAFVNTGTLPWPDPALAKTVEKLEIEIATVDADRIALGLGRPQLANVVLIGFSSGHPCSPFTTEEMRAAVQSAAPEKLAGINLEAFNSGNKP